MEGAFAGIGTGEFAAAVSKTGAVGCITASACKTPDGLREAIQKLRKATKNPFTVNVSIGLCPHIDGMFEVCFEEDVPAIETAGFRPDDYAERIRESGITWIHKGATVAFCKHAEKLGADAVVLVGLDGYGFKNGSFGCRWGHRRPSNLPRSPVHGSRRSLPGHRTHGHR